MLASRKWKAVLVDAIFSVLVLVISFWVADPKWSDFSLKLVAIIQPVVVAYVLGTAFEDGKAKEGQGFSEVVIAPEKPDAP